MTNCDGLGLRRAGSFAFEQFVVVSSGSADLRWALAALALQSLVVLGANCQALLVILAQGMARRVARKGRFAHDVAPADTTLAAGRG
jgi:hypothetical protein